MSHECYVLTTEVAEENSIFGSLLLFFPDWGKIPFIVLVANSPSFPRPRPNPQSKGNNCNFSERKKNNLKIPFFFFLLEHF